MSQVARLLLSRRHLSGAFARRQAAQGRALRARLPRSDGLTANSSGAHCGDWSRHGPFTVRGNHLHWLLRRWPGSQAVCGGLEATVKSVRLLGASGRAVDFVRQDGRVTLSGLPDAPPDPLCPVLRIECDRPPAVYQCGGLRVPALPHPHYDPCPYDMQH